MPLQSTSLTVSVLALLDHLERLESRLLTWGVVDGYFARDELELTIDSAVEGGHLPGRIAVQDALDALLEHRWLVRLDYPDGPVYRTRMAETVRLLARLKQLFPKHLRDRRWQVAPNLVSDYRLAIGLRRFPKRDLHPARVLQELREEGNLPPSGEAALSTLLRADQPSPIVMASFQLAATKTILAHLSGRQSTATIVSAGTGSGKTLAFYAPALSHVAAVADAESFVKVLALYPRNELLKDQLSEALKSVRRLNAAVGRAWPRIRVGAYFGETPRRYDSREVAGSRGAAGRGWICPFVRCPECDGSLTWLQEDRLAHTEVLRCLASGCGAIVSSDDFAWTRQSIQEQPPDVVFTTTEMLNRHMTNSWARHVFGLGTHARRKPRLMLLDEAHTYEGTSGAQAAYLIRRWHHALRAPVEFVGLSATLRDADGYFAQLTGIPTHLVADVSPTPEDMETGGNEYMLALRGDPVSGASLLSTSIQTAMLMRRSLDPSPARDGAYGSRMFLFTDDLDVTNRLYNDILDAEAVSRSGAPQPSPPLASLRSPRLPERLSRLIAGQSWDMSEEVGFQLETFRARVGRTSSQDAGVDQEADVIVATASLEVGFNDPTVGAILQHKAPRGAAQFLQRKGRAGRTRPMRPWTVVVLSDYGRDRLAYQGYDLLFDPELEPRSLPLGNHNVLKIQAAYALLDWLSEKGSQLPRGSLWRDLSGPAGADPAGFYVSTRQRHHLGLVTAVLSEEDVRDEFGAHLERSLGLSPDVVQSILWDAPRGILTSLLPTIRRRLLTQWRSGLRGTTRDYVVDGQPIPDFVPANLFSDLSLPEVMLNTPVGATNEQHPMPVLQALREFAPGRVSFRFGIRSSKTRHWVAVDAHQGDLRTSVNVNDFVQEAEELGEFTYTDNAGARRTVRCLRPWTIRLAAPPRSIGDTSNAFLSWATEMVPAITNATVDLPSTTSWSAWITELAVFLHVHHSGVEVRRFATGASASLSYHGGRRQELEVSFISADALGINEPVALGYVMDVDAFRLSLRPGWITQATFARLSPEERRALRTAYHQHVLISSRALDGIANGFERGWLAQLYTSVITAGALRTGDAVESLQRELIGSKLGEAMVHALDVVFEALPEEQEVDQPSPPDAGTTQGRVYDRLRELCTSSIVQGALAATAADIEAADSGSLAWLEERLMATLGAAVVQAIQRLCPDVDAAGSLIVDLKRNGDGSTLPAEVWISETNPGGGGVLQRAFAGYANDPRRFFRLVESALGPTDYELVDAELTRVLTWASEDGELTERLQGTRSAGGQRELHRAFGQLLSVLWDRGIHTSHAVVASLNRRILRPGSNEKTDALLRSLLERWRDAEELLGREIDARVFAYACKDSEDIETALKTSGIEIPDNSPQWRFGVIYGLLWPRGWLARAHSLPLYNPFTTLPLTDSWLLRELMLEESRSITAAADGQLPTDARQVLATDGTLVVVSEPADVGSLRATVLRTITEPIEAGYLYAHPRVAGVERGLNQIRLLLDLGDIPL